jgi:uncharacterized membrane protein (DUF485 family)
MPSLSLVRVGGLAAILAGMLLVLGELMNLLIDFETDPVEAATSGTSIVQSVVFLLGVALLLVGLVGLYIRLAEATGGLLGLVGFLLALVGTGMVMGVVWDQTFTVPALAQVAPTLLESDPPALVNFGFIISFVLFGLGWLLFGVEAYRARVYPRIAVILLMVGAVLTILPLPFVGLVFAVGVAWLGLALLTGRDTTAEQPSRVR